MKDIIISWKTKEGINSFKDILKWIDTLNKSLTVNISPRKLKDDEFWFYDKIKGEIVNKNETFFKIKGLKILKDKKVLQEQPIIIQDEIGYLGIICKEIEGILYFLMQAKIEPGNINKVQLSPTIQATKSNFMQQHGGGRPAYVEYFINAKDHHIIVDQIQSEQSSRFYKKRNRNIIIKIDGEIEVLPTHKWLTLGQIKELMKRDNLVNMDTRTVLSCIPYALQLQEKNELELIKSLFNDKALFYSIFNMENTNAITKIYNYINDYKMFNDTVAEIVSLNELDNWSINKEGVRCKEPYNFSVIYCDIEVEGREVRKWSQPLFKAEGFATFGLFTTVCDGIRKFLVKCTPENGCFDCIEIGPSIQLEPREKIEEDCVISLFKQHYKKHIGILYNVILSEEGGRFYHEQNYNVIIEIKESEIRLLPEGYFWVDYRTLNMLVQINNCLNIQLRNLLSLLEV